MQTGTFLILFVIHLVHAAFNETSPPNATNTWSGNSVQPNAAGTFCYFPAAGQTNATFCSGGHSESSTFQPVLNIHLHLSEGWSIAYYDANNKLLGNQNYSVIANTSTVQCLSGQAGDGTYQTLCMDIDYDNNISEAGSYCQVKLGQTYVSDGCYSAMPNTTSTASQPASTSSTSTNPSSSSFSSSSNTNPAIVAIVIPIVVATMGLFGTWSVAYCSNPWCRKQTNMCCCMCGRLAHKKKARKYAALDEVVPDEEEAVLDEDHRDSDMILLTPTSPSNESPGAGRSSRSPQLCQQQ